MKVEMTNYGAKFDLHCPRCGNVEWSEETYKITKEKTYRKCLHCGADVCTDEHTKISIVIEPPFREFNEHTYDVIRKELNNEGYSWESWKRSK